MSSGVLASMLDRDPATMPLEEIDVSHIDLWRSEAKWDFFKVTCGEGDTTVNEVPL